MTLRQLLQGLTSQSVCPIPVTGLACHSKKIRPGELFVAIRGAHQEGHDFVQEAIQRGACAVVVERPPQGMVRCPVVTVANTRGALAVIAARFYGEPASRLRFVGVTGTNGKTTTSYLIKAILEAAGYRVGLLGTVAYEIGGRHVPSENTTPGPAELQRLLSQMVEQGLAFCVMEVSSHALDQERIQGLKLEAATWTCLGSDHLDYHKTLERYAQAKRRIFSYLCPKGWAVLNADDPYCHSLIATLPDCQVLTYGLERAADVSVRNIFCTWQATSLVLGSPWGIVSVDTPLVGRHNVSNISAAASTCLALGVKTSSIQQALTDFQPVPGRMERVPNDRGVHVVIDYAHTACALRLVLLSLRELVHGRMMLVFGCGGDRDKTKRPAMGQIASLLADHVILTSDNPRSEDPLDIIRHIKRGFVPGFRAFQVAVDREEAIHLALSMARADDAVLIAGKGHEAYQIFDNVTVPFSDREIVSRYFATEQKIAVGVGEF